MTDPFDDVMGRQRGGGCEPRPSSEQSFLTRAKKLAADIVADRGRPQAVHEAAARSALRVITAWAVRKDTQVPMYFVSDGRVAAGRPPQAILVAWFGEDTEGPDDPDLNLVERVELYRYGTQAWPG